MAEVLKLTFNDFQENTYLVYDETGECMVIDPGCNSPSEEAYLVKVIEEKKLKPVRLINTHCHLDHVFGNHFVAKHFDIPLEIPEGELPVLRAVPEIAKFYGLPPGTPSPEPGRFIEEGEQIKFGKTSLEVILTPGHSPAGICLYSKEDGFLIAGDVLFYASIGRTDLPGGDFNTLISNIKNKLFPLGDNVKVYPGHGSATTIGFEKRNNPFMGN